MARNAGLAALLVPSLLFTEPVPMTTALSGVAAGLAFFLLYLLFNVFAALPPGRAPQRFA